MTTIVPAAIHMPLGAVAHFLGDPPENALCGAAVHRNRAGYPVPVDPRKPLGLTAGGLRLRWCPKCVGVLAGARGRLDTLVAELVAE